MSFVLETSPSKISDPGYGSREPSPLLDACEFPSKDARLSVHEHERVFTRQDGGHGVTVHMLDEEDEWNGRNILTRSLPAGYGNGTQLQEKRYGHPIIQDSNSDAPVWLGLYFALNLALTICNKLLLNFFPFPWTLTLIHSSSAMIGTQQLYRLRLFQCTARSDRRELSTLLSFSALYMLNIAISNLSLNEVSVPLHQVIRSLASLFTILISVVVFGKKYRMEVYLSLIPILVGVAFATHGDYAATRFGAGLTLFGAFLASVKGIATNSILKGPMNFHPLELVMRMSPMAAAQAAVMATISGEASNIYKMVFLQNELTKASVFVLVLNGTTAFLLNVVSFTANKKSGPLTMNIASDVKQVTTVCLAVVIFSLTLDGVNLFGIALTMAGGAYYTYIEFRSKN